jgi:HTH-type transcriptional regulator, sugar sensing transcriptional regulator
MNRVLLIEKLKQMGFSDYEAKCYLALFERDSLSVSEVSILAGVPRPNAYEALDKLTVKGLCLSIPGKTKKFAVADPEYLREKQLEKLHQTTLTIQENIDAVAGELLPLYKRRSFDDSPFDYMEIIKDPYHVHRKVIKLCNDCQEEILTFSKPPYAFSNKKQKEEQRNPQIESLKRGVKVRTIYELPPDDNDKIALFDAARPFLESGEKGRAIAELPIKMAIFDRKTVLFALVDPVIGRPSVTSLVAEHRALAMSFIVLFESFWEKAHDSYMVGNHKIRIPRAAKSKSRKE